MTKMYTKEHEWVQVENNIATVGVSVYAQEQLGDVVYVELPEVGTIFKRDEEMAVVESAKSASDIYAPIAGKVLAINEALEGSPALVNESPEQQGWLLKLEISAGEQFEHLLDPESYQQLLQQVEEG